MTLFAQCVHCQTKFKAKPELNGKSVRCPKCKKVFEVSLIEEKGSDKPGANEASRASISKSKILPNPPKQAAGKKAPGKAAGGKSAAKGKPAATGERPKWAGEPTPAAAKTPTAQPKIDQLHKVPPGKESPILRSRRKLASVILPGDRHVPAIEVPWGAPCNPPKDFLKEQAGTMSRAEATTAPATMESTSLIAPEEKEIRIEPQLPPEDDDDGALVESVALDVKPPKPTDEDPDALIAGVTEETTTTPKKKDVGFHRSAAEPVVAGTFTEETVTADNDGGFYRPALPGQHDDIYEQSPKILEKALAGAYAALGRGASIDELEIVENSKYVPQIRQILSDEEGFGSNVGKKSAGMALPSPKVMAIVGVSAGVFMLILLIVAVSTISSMLDSGGTDTNPFGYNTQITSNFPSDATGPARLVTVKFPSNYDEITEMPRPWLNTDVNGYRLVRPSDTFVMMYSSSIPGEAPGPQSLPSKEQLEVFGLQAFAGGNEYLTGTSFATLDDYPLIEYQFNADILRGAPGKTRIVFLFTQQRMFVFLWAGYKSNSEVTQFFDSISAKGHRYSGSN